MSAAGYTYTYTLYIIISQIMHSLWRQYSRVPMLFFTNSVQQKQRGQKTLSKRLYVSHRCLCYVQKVVHVCVLAKGFLVAPGLSCSRGSSFPDNFQVIIRRRKMAYCSCQLLLHEKIDR